MTTPPPTDEERKRQTAANFNEVADSYDAVGFRFVVPVATRLVELAALRPSERVLDVATGTGWAALAAARAVGAAGHVLGTDLAEQPLRVARAKAAQAGLAQVEFRSGDAEAPALADGAVDVTLCASAIFILPNPGRAVREWCRVTRPGGRVLFSAWSSRNFGALRDLYTEHLRQFLPDATSPPGLAAEECVRLLSDAGLQDIRVTEESFDYHVPNPEAWWTDLRAGPLRGRLLQLTEDQIARLRRDYLADVERLKTREGVPVEVRAIFASGLVPAA